MATDVNSLFLTHTIVGIKAVEEQIRGDIEKKKQELRILVGERYRDLINAADTIQDMEKASNEVFSGINTVGELCSAFSPSLGDTSESSKQTGEGVNEQAFYALATQMNLLVDTPEKVWSALDKHQYLTASQLYLLSQHIVDSTLHINTGQSRSGPSRDIYASFPIVHHQWAAISHFKPSILKGARSSLKDGTLPDKALSESLCCIALLDNFSPRQVFTEYLMARKTAIKDVFQPSLYSTSVKKQLCDITHLIKLTVEQIITMFHTYENEKYAAKENPLFYHTLHSLTDEKASVFQSLFEGDVDVITVSRYLPPLVSGFVPKLQSVPVSISVSFIQKHSLEWLSGCISNVHAGVKTLLSFVNNIKGLASIRNAVCDLLKVDVVIPQDEEEEEEEGNLQMPWSKYCEVCFNRTLSIWDEFFQPLFLERTKAILEKEFEGCFKGLSESLEDVLTSLGDPDNKIDDTCWDHNISSFVWHEFSYGATSLVNDKADGNDMLSLKVKGCTPAIKRLCSLLNNGLSDILNDARHFICGDEENDDEKEEKLKSVKKDIQRSLLDGEDKLSSIIEPSSRDADASAIKEELYNIFNSNVTSLCSYINGLLGEISTRLVEGEMVDPVIVTSELDKATFLAHFCLSVPDMCGNIQKIVDYDTDLSKTQVKRQLSRHASRKLPPKVTQKLGLLEKQFSEQTNRGFMIWENWICKMCCESVSTTLNSKDDFYLFSMTNWEDIHIEEESELGEKVKSTICVPGQISFYLSSLLFRMAEEFHRAGGNLMDKEHINAMALGIGSSIFKSHETFLSSSLDTVFQNQAFQIMFDLKFILKLFGGNMDPKDNELVSFNSLGNKLITELESCIDPFDLDVVVPHMNTFVQRQIQTTALLYGSISNIDKHAVQVHKRSADLSEQHSIVEMVSHPPRFMLLPLSGNSKSNRDNYQVPTSPGCLDYDSSPLFLHQSQSTISGLV